ncbi:MAG: hypothetical protein H0X41_11950 [Chitinophagaceae bacterium]|nr:hypothetical protein [Chitinophagaceae bacterium]
MSFFKILISKNISPTPFNAQLALNFSNETDLMIRLRGFIGKVGPSQLPALLHSDRQDRTMTCLDKVSRIRILSQN